MGKGRDKGVRIGNMDLARRADRKKVRDITVSLQLQTENLTRNDLRSSPGGTGCTTSIRTWMWTGTLPDAWNSVPGSS